MNARRGQVSLRVTQTRLSGQVIHVVASINEDIGGPAVSVSRLAQALVAAGQPSSIVTLDYPEHGRPVAVPGVEVTSIPAGEIAGRMRGYSAAFARALDRVAAGSCRAIHNHGLWMYPNICARKAARRHRIPLIVSPRGMLEPWSLGRSRFKKFLAWHSYERRNLTAAAAFHATSEDELFSIRRADLVQPVAVIPNGVDVPDAPTLPGRAALEARFPGLRGKRWLLFLSRIHPKKGVGDLVRAWAALATELGDVQLVIAGPDFENHQAVLARDVREAGLGDRITFTGMLVGDEKVSALSNADVFVLPTYSENFGIAIAEALAHGTPVVTTTAAPWRQIHDERCGWWIEPGPESLRVALREALNVPEEERRQMGIRGRELMLREYSWQKVAAQMKLAYEWICRGGPRPSFVHV